MSLDDSKEITTVQINQLINFIKRIEANNYYPEQFNDARKTIATIVEELSVLEHKLVSSLKNEEEMSNINILISANLKKRLKTIAISNNTTVTDILLSYIEKYLKMEDQKDGK
jgi:vacuolar-type H+-ATPase subunit H